MDFTSPQNFSSVFGDGLFTANRMLENEDLAKLFQQQKLQQEQQATEAKSLDNMFNRETMGERIRRPGLENIGFENKNRAEGVSSRISAATEGAQLTAKQQELAMKASEDQMKQMKNQAQMWALSPDPATQKRGLDTMNMYENFVLARQNAERAQKNALEAQAAQDAAAMARQKVQTDGQIEVAKIGAASRVANAGNRGTASSVALLPKLSPDKRLGHVRAVLESNVDPDTKEPLTPAARAYYQTLYDQDAQYLDAKPAPAAGVAPVIGPDGRVTIAPAPARPSVRADSGREAKGPVLPEGAKKIGTSNGKNVYQLPDGRKVIEQ